MSAVYARISQPRTMIGPKRNVTYPCVNSASFCVRFGGVSAALLNLLTGLHLLIVNQGSSPGESQRLCIQNLESEHHIGF
jgi:hypothetical protein